MTGLGRGPVTGRAAVFSRYRLRLVQIWRSMRPPSGLTPAPMCIHGHIRGAEEVRGERPIRLANGAPGAMDARIMAAARSGRPPAQGPAHD